jgi:hypothetical protein
MDRLDNLKDSSKNFKKKSVFLQAYVDEIDLDDINGDKDTFLDNLSLIDEESSMMSEGELLSPYKFGKHKHNNYYTDKSSKKLQKINQTTHAKSNKIPNLRRRRVKIQRIFGDPVSLRTVYLDKINNQSYYFSYWMTCINSML